MDKKDELQVRLAETKSRQIQVDVDLQVIKNNKERIIAEIVELEHKLEESKKPKLRHGEIRHWPNASEEHYDGLWSLVDMSDPSEPKQVWFDNAVHSIDMNWHKSPLKASTHVTYLLDDLKAMQEDVTEFEVGCNFVELKRESVSITDTADDESVEIFFPDLPNVILKLQQMEATLKRQEAKK